MISRSTHLCVCVITRKWPPAMGGMETYSNQIVKTLNSLLNLTLIRLPGNPDGMSPSALRIIAFGVKTALKFLTSGKKYDVVHGFDMAIWPLAWIAAWSAKAGAIVLSAHGTDVSFAYRSSIHGRLYAAYCRLGARLLPRAKILANSGATAELAKRLGFADIDIIPLAAQPHETDVEPRKERILFFGRLKSRKGCGWFIENVLPNLPDEIRVAIAGRREDAEEDWVLQHARVDYLGVLDSKSISRECASAICVVVPNRDFGIDSFEGFGLVAPEAAAAGGIVLASDLFGLKSAVRDGTTGFLIDPNDEQAWIDKISEVRDWSDERRAQFIAHSKTAAREYYSWARVARETIESYQNRLANPGGQ